MGTIADRQAELARIRATRDERIARQEAMYAEARATRTPIDVPMRLTPMHKIYFGDENFGHCWTMKDGFVFEGTFKHQRSRWTFSLSYGDEHHTTRREEGGPLEKIEDAYLIALPCVISAHPQMPVVRIPLVDGDLLQINGRIFQVRDNRALNDPQIVRVEI